MHESLQYFFYNKAVFTKWINTFAKKGEKKQEFQYIIEQQMAAIWAELWQLGK